jgi:transcription termination/antitermination protein NusA
MNTELQAMVEYLQRERGIDRETICRAIETAMMIAGRHGDATAEELRVEIDRSTYDLKAIARKTVVEGAAMKRDEISIDKARRIRPDAAPGDVLDVVVPADTFGRIGAQTAKQGIMQAIRQAEKEIIYEEYKDTIGTLLTGAVMRFDRSDVILNVGRAEAIMPSRERVPTEEYQVGDRIRALVVSVDQHASGTEIVLSRSDPEFVRHLFESEVSEIADHTVEIKGIAREPGYRTKLAVLSHDDKVDPVGACVGMRGLRVKAIVRELSGEKIDIVRWSDDIRAYVNNALAPAKLKRVDIDEETRTITVTVDSDQLSLAIGKRGQNARLTAKLTGWRVDIQKDEAQISFEEKVAVAIERLAAIPDIGPSSAELLVQSGFLTIEGIMAAEISDLEELDGIDREAAVRIHQAAEKAYELEHGPIREL